MWVFFFFSTNFPKAANFSFLDRELNGGFDCSSDDSQGDEPGTSTIAVDNVCVSSQLGEQQSPSPCQLADWQF